MLTSFIYTCFVWLITAKIYGALGFRGTVVEYSYQYDPLISVADNLLKNAAVHSNIIHFLRNKSDIVVFPEASLSPISGSRSAHIVAPQPSYANVQFNTKALQLISDAAKSSNLYVVINIPEKYGKQMYSTNLVFRRNGTVAARYRNYNVGGEDIDRPQIEAVHFDTDFGIKFGVISSSDLMFPSPVKELLKLGIKHYVCPSAWTSRLPFLTANQMQQSWSWSRDVNLLAAGLNSVESGQSGSGIYRGRSGHLTRTPLTYFFATIPTTLIITSDLRNHHKHSDSIWDDLITQNFSLKKLSVQSRYQKSSRIFAKSSPDVENVSVWSRVLQIEKTSFMGYSTKMIKPNNRCSQKNTFGGLKWRCEYNDQLCHGQLCCQFNLTVDYFICSSPCLADNVMRGMKLDDSFYLFRYRMAVFDGVESLRKGGDTWGAQICGVIPCLDTGLNSCGKKPDPSQYRTNVFTFGGTTTRIWAESVSAVRISGNFTTSNNSVMPSLLLGRTSSSLDRFGLLTNDFKLETEGAKGWTLRLPDEERNLGVGGIINRVYSRDGSPPTYSGAAALISVFHSTSLIVLLIITIIY